MSSIGESRATGHSAARRQRGFTLLEVLVAILILSFGVLGAAGMQAAALQANKQARLQANATQLAHQLTDLMRANNTIAKAATSNPFLLDNVNGVLPTYTVDCTTTTCLPADSANWAVAGWIRQMVDASNAGDLPGAKVIVCFDDLPFDATTGKPKWGCSGQTSAATPLYVKLAWTTAAIGAGASAPNPSAPLYQDWSQAPFLVLPALPG